VLAQLAAMDYISARHSVINVQLATV